VFARLEPALGPGAHVRPVLDRPVACQVGIHWAIYELARAKPNRGGSRFVAR
jgi:hypothetical protein